MFTRDECLARLRAQIAAGKLIIGGGAGMGFAKEVDMIAAASDMGLLTCPYVFTPEEAEQMAKAGADVLIPHMGLTTKGSIGAKSALTLADAAKRVQELCDAA